MYLLMSGGYVLTMLNIYPAKIAARTVASLLFVLLAAANAHPQMAAPAQDPFADLISKLPFLRNALEERQPGLTDPASPLVQTPLFRLEAKFRVLWVTMTDGALTLPAHNLSVGFRSDLGIPDNVGMTEAMARGQIGRASLRIHYDGYTRGFQGTHGYFQWPEFRVGGDFDLVERYGLRAGVNADACTENPTLSYSLPAGPVELRRWPKPLTVGIHAAWNPFGWGGLSSSLEVRYRWPAKSDTRVNELELAAGVKAPQTILGTTGIRGGWRYTVMELSQPDFQSKVKLSAPFAEVFWYF